MGVKWHVIGCGRQGAGWRVVACRGAGGGEGGAALEQGPPHNGGRHRHGQAGHKLPAGVVFIDWLLAIIRPHRGHNRLSPGRGEVSADSGKNQLR